MMSELTDSGLDYNPLKSKHVSDEVLRRRTGLVGGSSLLLFQPPRGSIKDVDKKLRILVLLKIP